VIADEAGHRFAAAQNRWALGAAELSAGAAEAAWDALGEVLVFLRTQDVRLPGVVAVHADAVEAAVACGRTDAAAAALADLEAGGGPPGVVAWLRGVVSGAQGDREASTSLDAAIAQLRGDDRPYELGRALLAGGIAHRRRKARGAARALLDEAATRFDALGAAGWAARARSEQARVAGRRAATDRDALTDAERRIAEHAAGGRTNREIAAALFVTERTVEANLTRVYRKLGVRSRTELARRL
jgi:DNA-binding NarL/FixJ family response regulator